MAKATPIYRLKVTLKHIDPPIWRRIETKDCSLDKLNLIIQICFNWEGYHLWAFTIGDLDYGDADDMENPRKLMLSQLTAQGVKKFPYMYDFGDSWEHIIQIEKPVAADPQANYPRCVQGSRAGPPEDCGGWPGYYDVLEAVKDGPKTDRQDELREWLGESGFDPEAFDIKAINKMLAQVK